MCHGVSILLLTWHSIVGARYGASALRSHTTARHTDDILVLVCVCVKYIECVGCGTPKAGRGPGLRARRVSLSKKYSYITCVRTRLARLGAWFGCAHGCARAWRVPRPRVGVRRCGVAAAAGSRGFRDGCGPDSGRALHIDSATSCGQYNTLPIIVTVSRVSTRSAHSHRTLSDSHSQSPEGSGLTSAHLRHMLLPSRTQPAGVMSCTRHLEAVSLPPPSLTACVCTSPIDSSCAPARTRTR